MSVKFARLGSNVQMLEHEEDMTVRKLLSQVGSGPESGDIRVNAKQAGLDDRIPDESLVTQTPRIRAG